MKSCSSYANYFDLEFPSLVYYKSDRNSFVPDEYKETTGSRSQARSISSQRRAREISGILPSECTFCDEQSYLEKVMHEESWFPVANYELIIKSAELQN